MRQLGIDCITNLPKTEEWYDTIVTSIDYTGKWPESKPLNGKFIEGATEFMCELVIMELPRSISLTMGENLSTKCV